MIPLIEMDFTGEGNSWQAVNPRNYKDIEIAAVFAAYSPSGSFEGMYPSVSVQSIDLEFYNASPPSVEFPNGGDAYNIWEYRKNGLTGGPGLGMGIPLRIRDAQNLTTTVFVGCLDITKNTVTWEQDKVVAPIRQSISLDWFYSTIESISFYTLRQYQIPADFNGQRTNDGKVMSTGQLLMGAPGTGALYQYKVTAFNIKYANELPHLISFIISMITQVTHLVEAIKSTIKNLSDLAADLTESVTALYTVPGLLQVAGDVIAIVYDIVEDIILLSGIIGNIELMLNQIGMIDKYKYCMAVTDIIYAVLTYVNQQNGSPNITFSSSIFGVGKNGVGYGGAYASTASQGLTWMPKKNIIVNQSVKPSIANFVNGAEHPLGDETKPGTLGPPYGCPDGNVKDFFKKLCIPFNANIKLIPIGGSNDIQFEEMHFWKTPVNFTLPNEGKPGLGVPTLPDPHKTNWHELSYGYELAFMLDPKDGNTDQRYNGTTCQALIQPKVSYNVLNWLNPGGKTVMIPFALAKTKQWLTLTDDVINFIIDAIELPFAILTGFYDVITGVVNAAIGAVGGNPNAIPAIKWTFVKISSPYPYLELTEDTFSVPKLFMGVSYGSPPGTLNEYGPPNNAYTNSPSQPFSAGNANSFYSKSTMTPSPFYGDCWQPSNNDSPYPDPNGDGSFNASAPIGNSRNESYVSADVLMRLFHSLNLATPAQNGYQGGNQWLLYGQKQFKMCVSDFLNILQNGNVINWVDGNTPCFLEKILWKMDTEMALEVAYRINQPYTNNLTLQISVDGTAI